MKKFCKEITIVTIIGLLWITFYPVVMDAAKKAHADGGNDPVEEILKNTPFKKITPENYWTEVGIGKVVMFYYVEGNEPNSCTRLAEVYKEVIKSRPDVKFVFMEGDRKIRGEYYISTFNIRGAPYFIFYNNGEQVFANKGGPIKGEEHFWIEGIIKDMEKYFEHQIR